MPNLLKVKRIMTVGFVDEGANPEADILIWKSRNEPTETPSTDATQPEKEGGQSMAFDINTLSAEAQAEFQKLQELAAQVPALEEERDTLQEQLSKAADPPASTEPEDVMKGLDPKVQELFKSLSDRADASEARAEEVVEKLATSELEGFAKADLAALSGEVADQVRILRLMQKSLKAEEFTAVKEMFKGAAAAVKAADVLKRELGASEPETVGGGAFAKVQAKGAELVRDGKFDTIQKAVAHILRTDNALAKEYEAERRVDA